MKVNVVFSESNHSFDADFGEVHGVSDGGYERGYEAGYGDGYTKGHADGLAERTYEIWTLTLVDGTVIEKEVALL